MEAKNELYHGTVTISSAEYSDLIRSSERTKAFIEYVTRMLTNTQHSLVYISEILEFFKVEMPKEKDDAGESDDN